MHIPKKYIPISIAFLMGMIGIFTYYIPTKTSQDMISMFSGWDRIIAGFTLIVGIYSLLNHHYHKLKRKVPGWGYSVIVYIGMVAMVIAGFWFSMDIPEREDFGTWSQAKQRMLLQMNGVALVDTQQEYDAYIADNKTKPEPEDPPMVALNTTDGLIAAVGTIKTVPINWMYVNLFVPMQATMFALLAFYIASAAYRAFRARTTEATVLLATAIIMMIGRVPLGEWMWKDFPNLTEWILSFPSMAAQRGIMIGIGLGMIATSLRIIFGIERTYMGGGGE